MAQSDTDFDLCIVGAGVNGAGIARDAAMRGLRVIILEKSDVCSGTSAWSSRLIHGGLRYLEFGEIPLVYESLHERRNLRVIAPHLVKPLRINIPIYRGARRGPLMIRLGMIAYDTLSIGKAMPGHDMLSRDELLAEVPGLNPDGLRAGARYYDAQVAYAERLIVENLIAAADAGAEIRTWHKVTRMKIDGDRIQSVEWHDVLNDRRGSINASLVINAGGPWVDQVLETTTRDVDRLVGGTKGSHIIVGPFAGAPKEAFYVEAAADGRPIFIIPWNGQILIGTTDIRCDEDLDEVRASKEEINYLLAETNRIFPNAALSVPDIHFAYAGVRPLPFREKGPESAITRKHIIKRNRRIADNLISIIGGKLTTYRHLAEQAVDKAGRLLGRKLADCETGSKSLPGGADPGEIEILLKQDPGISDLCAARLVSIYGRRAESLLANARADGELRMLNDAKTVLAAEVSFVIREEFAKTLMDIVFRRMMIGLDADQGRPMYDAVADIAAATLNWSAERRSGELKLLHAFSQSLMPPV
ncbi:MAG: glycerol-3-phosphate dehydrogenase [Woeseiaceae bacterium]|nr:glycerol-3-phosphate dehydrogenase [Woeseiaceae bacterium]